MTTPEKNRILVIDDEKIIADTLVLIFCHAGYEARPAYSAEQALESLTTGEWIPQLAIIDVRLPGMNGVDLAIRLKAEYPDMRLSLFSGQAATSELLDVARLNGHTFDVLAKPVHPTEFLGLASRLLSSPGARE